MNKWLLKDWRDWNRFNAMNYRVTEQAIRTRYCKFCTGRGGCNNFVAISNSLRAASTRWKATGRSIGTFIDETWSNEIKKWLGFNRFVNDEFFPRSNFHHLISLLAYPRGKLQTNREKEYLKRLKFNSENLRKLIYARIEIYWNSFFVKWKRTNRSLWNLY